MPLRIATIKISTIGSVRIYFYSKGDVSIDVIADNLKSAYNKFFKEAKLKKYNLTELNTVFSFIWEKRKYTKTKKHV